MGNAVDRPDTADGERKWQPLGLELTPRVLAEVLDGGQAFRWNRGEDGNWTGMWAEHVVRLRADSAARISWQPLSPKTSATDVIGYLGEDAAWRALADQLPWRSDPVLAAAMADFPGLRILRQPLGETLLGFLCSSSKQIVQIKAMMALLAERFGPRRAHLPPMLPDWKTLAQLTEAELRACKLGYRARYIAATAQKLAARPDWEAELSTLDYPAAHAWLCTLPGVGAKIADCVLLFGAQRLEAFPVDTWILKILSHKYGLEGWNPTQLATFGRAHFGPLAGLAQQYLFAAARDAR